MRVYIPFFLPEVQFLHKGAGFVFPSFYWLLQGINDLRHFAFFLCFLGEDDRIDCFLYRLDILHLLLFVLLGAVLVEIDNPEIIDIIDHGFE